VHAAVRAHDARVRKVAVEPRRADERDDPFGRTRDLLDRLVRRPYEARAKQKILGRVTGDRELGVDDEVGACGPRVLQRREDLRAVPAEVADDGVQLCQRQSQGFRLTVTNRV
jgi:hypothetical protein